MGKHRENKDSYLHVEHDKLLLDEKHYNNSWMHKAKSSLTLLILFIALTHCLVGYAAGKKYSDIKTVIIKPDIHIVNVRSIEKGNPITIILTGVMLGPVIGAGAGIEQGKRITAAHEDNIITDSIDQIVGDAIADATYKCFVDGLNNVGIFTITDDDKQQADAQLLISVTNWTYMDAMNRSKNPSYAKRTPNIYIAIFLVNDPNPPFSYTWNDPGGGMAGSFPSVNGSSSSYKGLILRAERESTIKGSLPRFDLEEYNSNQEKVQNVYYDNIKIIADDIIDQLCKKFGKERSKK
jgi:hypothetical protein